MEAPGVSTAFFTKPETSPQRKEFYGRLDQKSTAPLWEVLGRIIPPEPTPETVSDRKSTRLNSSHVSESRMPSSA